jgi:hypothetical protein
MEGPSAPRPAVIPVAYGPRGYESTRHGSVGPMHLEQIAIAASLAGLGAALGVLAVRGFVRAYTSRKLAQAMWGAGMALGAAAMAIEFLAYVGVVTEGLLQGYVFLSAGIVGVLSLGAAGSLHRPRLARAYAIFESVAIGVTAVASFATPLSLSIVVAGIIVGNPPVLLLLLSSVVTVPATVVLLGTAVVSLRRAFRWSHVTMLAGACVLGAGGAFYIASFPVMLYYAEFVGIVMLFVGLVNLARLGVSAPSAVAAVRTE